MSALAAMLTTWAVWLCWPEATIRRLRADRRRRLGVRVRAGVLLGAIVIGAPLAGVLLGGVRGAVFGWVLGVGGVVAAGTGLRAVAVRRRTAVSEQVARGCAELAGLLRAGYPPLRALEVVAAEAALFAGVAAHHRVGGDVVAALRTAAQQPGASGLGGLATAWQIAERTGAALTTALDDLAANLAAERDLARTVTTELAAARLTGRLLGFLPLAGLGLGYAVGGDPVRYLTGSPAGLACLGIGVGLAGAGVAWSESLAERAGRLS